MSHRHDEHYETNPTDNPSLESMLDLNINRRRIMAGGLAAATTVVGFGLVGCDGDDNGGGITGPVTSPTTPPAPTPTPTGPKLGFAPVAKSLDDLVRVPTGYSASVLYRTGDPINTATGDYPNNGSSTGDSFDFRAGEHHDGMYYFGLGSNGKFDVTASSRGLLCMNHENISGGNQIFMHASGPTSTGSGTSTVRSVADEVIKEVNMHGVSVIEVTKNATNQWSYSRSSTFNRRITALTESDISGPAAGNGKLFTVFSPTGVKTRGTINNCANGFTPWGTYLTCEENHAGYFRRNTGDAANRTANENAALTRYQIPEGARGNYDWATATAPSGKPADIFTRWNMTKAAAGTAATADFQNVMNTFGWIVEIDPFAPASLPVKRTALGRFSHEGCWPGPVVVGKPVVFYMGDDNRGDYLYKFVSTANWDAADFNGGLAAGAKYMNAGKLYVAKFTTNGAGEWLELNLATVRAAQTASGVTSYTFADEADVVIHARLAADARGATKMDRPEWTGVSPTNGEVYLTLTNNNATLRPVTGTDFANPRSYNDPRTPSATAQRGNPNGHIIRLREAADNPAATTFSWDNYLFGARASITDANINISGLTANNDFSSPDGLWFANNGILWIQTDDGAYTDVTNCMMLAAIPGRVSDGTKPTITNTDGTNTRTQETSVGVKASDTNLLRFLVGPKGAEITGITEAHDGRTLFVNIQHPGEDTTQANFTSGPASYQSGWPHGADAQATPVAPANNARPRSATIVITKNDGGVLGL